MTQEERIQHAREWLDNHDDGKRLTTSHFASLLAAYAQSREVKWVKVGERLPERDGKYYVFDKERYKYEASFKVREGVHKMTSKQEKPMSAMAWTEVQYPNVYTEYAAMERYAAYLSDFKLRERDAQWEEWRKEACNQARKVMGAVTAQGLDDLCRLLSHGPERKG